MDSPQKQKTKKQKSPKNPKTPQIRKWEPLATLEGSGVYLRGYKKSHWELYHLGWLRIFATQTFSTGCELLEWSSWGFATSS